MLKVEIVMDKEKLINDGFDFNKCINILCNVLKAKEFIEAYNEEGHIIYNGADSPEDFPYFGLLDVLKQFSGQYWFRKYCTRWLFLNGSVVIGDFIEMAKRYGYWE